MKKILTLTLLTATLLNAEIEQSGFFVGVDMSNKTSKIDYATSDTANPSNIRDISDYDSKPLSYKIGYQYYFARVYARMAEDSYKDTLKNRYEIDSKLYEMNADYLPLFYMNGSKDFALRGVFGVGVGYTDNKVSNTLSSATLEKGMLDGKPNQKYMIYGGQVGVMLESSYGLSLEVGARFREGALLEYTIENGTATFDHMSTEFYLGLNYLF